MAALRPVAIRTPQRAHLAGKPLVRTSTLRHLAPRRRTAVPVAFQSQESSEVTKIEEWRVKRVRATSRFMLVGVQIRGARAPTGHG